MTKVNLVQKYKRLICIIINYAIDAHIFCFIDGIQNHINYHKLLIKDLNSFTEVVVNAPQIVKYIPMNYDM